MTAASNELPRGEVSNESNLNIHRLPLDTRNRIVGNLALDIEYKPTTLSDQDILDYLSSLSGSESEFRAGPIFQAWHTIRSCHEGYVATKYQKYLSTAPHITLATKAKRWEESGLMVDFTNHRSMEGLDVEALANSIVSGRIRAITQDEDDLAEALTHFVNYIDVQAELGSWDGYENFIRYIDNMKELKNFLYTLSHEARTTPYSGKFAKGPHAETFGAVMEEITYELTNIEPTLSLEALHGFMYQNPQVQQAQRYLDSDQQRQLLDLYETKTPRLVGAMQINRELFQTHTLPVDLFNTPPYSRQENADSCAATAFRMIFEGITDEPISDFDLESAVRSIYGDYRLHDEDFLTMLETPAFQERYGKRVQSLQYIGADLEYLGNLATRLKAKRPDAKLFLTASLKSETNRDPNVQHRVIILNADDNNVTVHDPSKACGVGKPSKPIPKDYFYQRWAAAQNSGYLVIAA